MEVNWLRKLSMKLSQRRKALISVFSIFLLATVNSVSIAQTNPTSISKSQNGQGKTPIEQTTLILKRGTLKEAAQVTQKDGSQRIVPVVTGEVLWWVILTVLSGTLIAIVVIVALGSFSSRNLQPGEKNQYLTEALPALIEGITIVYIVLAVLLLCILGIASTEGALSILAGISGYVLGKERSSGRGKDNKLPPETRNPKDDSV